MARPLILIFSPPPRSRPAARTFRRSMRGWDPRRGPPISPNWSRSGRFWPVSTPCPVRAAATEGQSLEARTASLRRRAAALRAMPL
jgi:hypothetical protein